MLYNKTAIWERHLFFILAAPIWLLTEIGIPTYYFTVPAVILMQILILKLFSNTQPLIIFSLYLFVYFLYLIPYFYFGMQLSSYTKYQNEHYYNMIAFMFYLFYLGMLLAGKFRIREKGLRLFDKCSISTNKYQRVIFYGLFAVVFLMSLRQGQNVISGDSVSYQAYMENLENINGMPLYAIMLMSFLPLILKNATSSKIKLGILFLIFALFCITRGLRIVMAPLGLLAFLVFVEGKIKNKSLYVMLFIGYSFFVIANALKMNVEMQIGMLFSESDEDYILSHHSDMLYGTAAGIGLIENGIVTFFQRMILNITYVLEMVIPPSLFPDEYKFPQIITSATPVGGGGLCILAAFYMWGYIGIVMLGYWFTRFVCISYYRSSSFRVLICIIVLIFFPRWVSYDFNNLIRFPFFAFLAYYFIFKFKFSLR